MNPFWKRKEQPRTYGQIGESTRFDLAEIEEISSLRSDISSRLTSHESYLSANKAGIEQSMSGGMDLISPQKQATIMEDCSRVGRGIVAVNQLFRKLDDCYEIKPLGILRVKTNEIQDRYYPSHNYSIQNYLCGNI